LVVGLDFFLGGRDGSEGEGEALRFFEPFFGSVISVREKSNKRGQDLAFYLESYFAFRRLLATRTYGSTDYYSILVRL
jgi:hypothetical protein